MDRNRISLSSGSGSNDEKKFDSNGNLEQAIYEVDERTRLIASTADQDEPSVEFVLSQRDARLWRIARILGYISAALLILLGVACFIESSRSESSSLFAFAFSCLLDSSGAMVVIWRSFSTVSVRKSRIRELQSQVLIGCLFWLAAMFILIRAMLYLYNLDEQDEKESEIIYILLGIGCGLQFFFFLTKTPIAVVLKSSALIADGVNSLAACILAITGIVVSVLGESSETLAIIDDLVGVIVSFFIASYGTYLLTIVWMDPFASNVFHIPQAPCASRSA
eukprot:XP_011680999.1 PREDICTED: transmembrane protein 163-like [Strongylocentrotus purpuratus]